MNAKPSSPIVADTATDRPTAAALGIRTLADVHAAQARGDLPAGTIIEREVIDVAAGDGWRHLEPGAITIKAGA